MCAPSQHQWGNALAVTEFRNKCSQGESPLSLVLLECSLTVWMRLASLPHDHSHGYMQILLQDRSTMWQRTAHCLLHRCQISVVEANSSTPSSSFIASTSCCTGGGGCTLRRGPGPLTGGESHISWTALLPALLQLLRVVEPVRCMTEDCPFTLVAPALPALLTTGS